MKCLIILDFQLFENNLGDMGGLGSKHPKKNNSVFRKHQRGRGE